MKVGKLDEALTENLKNVLFWFPKIKSLSFENFIKWKYKTKVEVKTKTMSSALKDILSGSRRGLLIKH